MEQVSLKIGERLKEIRNTRQLTLDDVAELTGVSKPMLGQIERGQSSPTINTLFQPGNVEAFYIEFDAGVCHASLPHVTGVEEYVFLVHGALKMVIGGKEVLLQEKQSIRFGADISHAYHNASDKACAAYNVIFYPNN